MRVRLLHQHPPLSPLQRPFLPVGTPLQYAGSKADSLNRFNCRQSQHKISRCVSIASSITIVLVQFTTSSSLKHLQYTTYTAYNHPQMAFSPNLPDALDKARNRNSFTPSDTSLFSFFDVAPRSNSLRESPHALTNDEARGNLHRRFTTNTVPLLHNVLSPIGQPRRQATESSAGPEYSLGVSEISRLETISHKASALRHVLVVGNVVEEWSPCCFISSVACRSLIPTSNLGESKSPACKLNNPLTPHLSHRYTDHFVERNNLLVR